MVSPTKPIGPQAAVAAPQSSTTAAAETPRDRTTLAPRPRATSSPSDRVLRTRPSTERQQAAGDQERGDLHDDRHVPTGQRPDRPEPELVEGGLIQQQHRAGDGAEGGAEGRAGQRQLDRGGAFPAQGGDRVDDHRRHCRAGEGEPDVAEDRGHAEGGDADHDQQRGAGVDPEDAGIGQRVAGDTLHHGTGQTQRGADQDAQDRARQPQLADHQVIGVRPGRRRRSRPRRRRAAVTRAPMARLRKQRIATASAQPSSPRARDDARLRMIGSAGAARSRGITVADIRRA